MRKTSLRSNKEADYSSVDWLGLFIREYYGGQRHVGFLFKIDDNDPPMFCEQRAHFDLQVREAASDSSWTDIRLDEVSKKSVATWIYASLLHESQMPYGFDWKGEVFDDETGAIIQPPPGKGLTCASFVLAVLKNQGFDLIDATSWEMRHEDEQWEKSMITLLETFGAPKSHIEALKEDVPAKRVRPEEVVGASLQEHPDEWPVDFDTAVAQADLILSDLHSIMNS